MKAVVLAMLASAAVVLPNQAAAQAAPTSPRGGDTRGNIPPHVREQLWPTRDLSPAEQQLKNLVLVLGDSIRPVEASHQHASRQQRAGANPTLFRSTGRTLSLNCGRAMRTLDPVIEFGASLSTSDQRWGDRAVERWRTALAELKAEMGRCDSNAASAIGTIDANTPGKVTAVSESAQKAVTAYRKAESELLNTLRINVDPRERI